MTVSVSQARLPEREASPLSSRALTDEFTGATAVSNGRCVTASSIDYTRISRRHDDVSARHIVIRATQTDPKSADASAFIPPPD